MNNRLKILGLTLLLTLPASHGVRAADASQGAALFDSYCSDCHSPAKGGSSRSAPNLWGVIGRKTGSDANFGKYSDVNKNAGWVWSAEILDRYLTAPKKAIPGTVMKFKGIDDAAERADVVAYLATLHD